MLSIIHECIITSVNYYSGKSISCTHSNRDKEVHLPFPQEHPFTSHISRFAIFPDTNGQTSTINSSDKQQADAQTQTLSGVPNPPKLYKVSQKAGDWGQRVECRYPSTPTGVLLESGVGKMFWDLPRSQRHNVRHEYKKLRTSH